MADKPIAYVGRHGSTLANERKLFRGWSPIDLSDEGYDQARAMRDFLKSKKIDRIISSPLPRAYNTALIVSESVGVGVEQDGGLLPWHIGIFASEPKDEVQDALRLFVQSPLVCVPKGESLEDFESRQFAFWKLATERVLTTNDIVLFVCHTSNCTALVNFSEGAENVEPEFGDSVSPGGVAAVYWDGKKFKVEPIFGEGETAQFGGS